MVTEKKSLRERKLRKGVTPEEHEKLEEKMRKKWEEAEEERESKKNISSGGGSSGSSGGGRSRPSKPSKVKKYYTSPSGQVLSAKVPKGQESIAGAQAYTSKSKAQDVAEERLQETTIPYQRKRQGVERKQAEQQEKQLKENIQNVQKAPSGTEYIIGKGEEKKTLSKQETLERMREQKEKARKYQIKAGKNISKLKGQKQKMKTLEEAGYIFVGKKGEEYKYKPPKKTKSKTVDKTIVVGEDVPPEKVADIISEDLEEGDMRNTQIKKRPEISPEVKKKWKNMSPRERQIAKHKFQISGDLESVKMTGLSTPVGIAILGAQGEKNIKKKLDKWWEKETKEWMTSQRRAKHPRLKSIKGFVRGPIGGPLIAWAGGYAATEGIAALEAAGTAGKFSSGINIAGKTAGILSKGAKVAGVAGSTYITGRTTAKTLEDLGYRPGQGKVEEGKPGRAAARVMRFGLNIGAFYAGSKGAQGKIYRKRTGQQLAKELGGEEGYTYKKPKAGIEYKQTAKFYPKKGKSGIVEVRRDYIGPKEYKPAKTSRYSVERIMQRQGMTSAQLWKNKLKKWNARVTNMFESQRGTAMAPQVQKQTQIQTQTGISGVKRPSSYPPVSFIGTTPEEKQYVYETMKGTQGKVTQPELKTVSVPKTEGEFIKGSPVKRKVVKKKETTSPGETFTKTMVGKKEDLESDKQLVTGSPTRAYKPHVEGVEIVKHSPAVPTLYNTTPSFEERYSPVISIRGQKKYGKIKNFGERMGKVARRKRELNPMQMVAPRRKEKFGQIPRGLTLSSQKKKQKQRPLQILKGKKKKKKKSKAKEKMNQKKKERLKTWVNLAQSQKRSQKTAQLTRPATKQKERLKEVNVIENLQGEKFKTFRQKQFQAGGMPKPSKQRKTGKSKGGFLSSFYTEKKHPVAGFKEAFGIKGKKAKKKKSKKGKWKFGDKSKSNFKKALFG